jgi:aryl-alcohol dehydrogenase-like predicted oxidoreductase
MIIKYKTLLWKKRNVSASCIAINWMLQQKQVGSVLLGPRTLEQVEDNLKALEFNLTEEEMKKLNEVSSASLKYIFPNDWCSMDSNKYWKIWWGEKKYDIKF